MRSDAARAEHGLQRRAALQQRRAAQVVAGEIRDVEQVVADRVAARGLERTLQRLEIRHAIGAKHDDLAVVPARRQRQFGQRLRQGRQLRGPVVAVACEAAHARTVDPRQHAVAVELDFVEPVVGIGRRRVDQGCELRPQARRQRGLLRPVGDRRRGASGAATARLPLVVAGAATGGGARLLRWPPRVRVRLACPAASSATCRRRRRRHRQVLDAVGQFVDDAERAGRPRVLVLLLDQQPRLLLFAVALHPHQHPAAVQLVAAQLELQVAVAIALARVAVGQPGALVPDDHLAGAVLLRRDRALERVVRDRVVLDVNRHAPVVRVEARPLRHRPALHRAVELEAEVVVQPRRPVLLHDERARRRVRLAALGRFRGDREIALGAVALQ